MAWETPDLLGLFESNIIRRDVGIVEFAESEEFCNKKLYPRQKVVLKLIFLEDLDEYEEKVLDEWIASSENGGEVTICPKIRERIQWLKDNGYPHFRQIQLVGGRRSGKGYMTAMALAYKLYKLTQIDNVGSYYGIERGKSIYFSIVADSLDQAKAHQFGDATNAIIECKPIIEQGLLSKALAETTQVYTPYDKRRISLLRAQGAQVDRDLASLIVKAYGTNSKTIRGSASIMMIFDEMAHLVAGESRMSDEELHKAAMPSLATFKKDAMAFYNSSPYTKTGKFFELYESGMKLDPPEDGFPIAPDHLILQFPSWEMYKDWEKEGDKFPHALIEPPEVDSNLAREEMADPESFKVEYRAQFAEVVDAFLRPEMVDRMFDPDFNIKTLGRDLSPQAGAVGYVTYTGHGDPSAVNANFGIAIGHLETIKNKETGIDEPHVVFDFINAFRPQDFEDDTIDWLQVLPTIEGLIDNFRPATFTFDQFDSRAPIQILSNNLAMRGIQSTQIHVIHATKQINEMRANNFKAALNLGRVHAPHPVTYGVNPGEFNPIELAKLELKFLTEKNGRVDRQKIGPVQTKDIADCLMEVTNALIGELLSMESSLLRTQTEFGAQVNSPYSSYGSAGSDFEDWYPRNKSQQTPHYPQRGRDYSRARRPW